MTENAYIIDSVIVDGAFAHIDLYKDSKTNFDILFTPMSKSKTDNVLVVYDWKGKFVTTLKINLAVESESMFYAAGRYYVAFYSGSKVGMELYEIKPVHYYTYVK